MSIGFLPRVGVLTALAGLAGCGLPPPYRTMPCAAAPAPAIARSADGAIASTTLSVLTYNVEGLPWPARSGRGPALRAIAADLRALARAGRAPDVVMFQEMFSNAARRAVADSGYPAIEPGPERTTRAGWSSRERLPGKARMKRGEIGLKLMGGGLAIASRYPVLHAARQAYGRRSCAGIDCLANKGIQLARIGLPGLPAPIDLYNTHMNSGGASKAPEIRHVEAHARQAEEAGIFMAGSRDPRAAVILGGDFNMRQSEPRWYNFSPDPSLRLVHRVCADPDAGCDVRMSWDGDEPWMDTQDLHFYAGGDAVSVRPIRVEAMFDGGPGGARLSDHDGFLVTYRLSWPAGLPARSACAPAQGDAARRSRAAHGWNGSRRRPI